MIYRGGFELVRMEVCGKFWFVKVYLLSNSLDAPLLKLLILYFVPQLFLFQANSNLIGHLQLGSCKMGKLPGQRKEKLNTHK